MKRFAIATISILLSVVSCVPTPTPQPAIALATGTRQVAIATALATATLSPTETPTISPLATLTNTPVPTATSTPTPLPTLQGMPSVPGPHFTNPELFDTQSASSPIVKYVNAMEESGISLAPENVSQSIAYRQLQDKSGSPFVIEYTHLARGVATGDYPLLVARRNKEGQWQWSTSTPKILGDVRGVEVGVAGNYQELGTMLENFNTSVSDWAFDWNLPTPPLRPSMSSFDFRGTDYAVDFGEKFEYPPQVHYLIWSHYPILPDWLKNGNYSKDELLQIIQNHVQTVVSRYKGRVAVWSVVNEPLGEPSNQSFWENKLGGSDWIALAFSSARQADPNAQLILNDYGIEFSGNPKGDQILNLVKDLKAKGVPIDGVGFQMHLWGADFATEEKLNTKIDNLVRNIERFGNYILDKVWHP